EAAIPVAEQHADATRTVGKITLVQDHDVLLAVAVEVGRHDGRRTQAHRERDRRRKTKAEQISVLQRFNRQPTPRRTGAWRPTAGMVATQSGYTPSAKRADRKHGSVLSEGEPVGKAWPGRLHWSRSGGIDASSYKVSTRGLANSGASNAAARSP